MVCSSREVGKQSVLSGLEEDDLNWRMKIPVHNSQYSLAEYRSLFQISNMNCALILTSSPPAIRLTTLPATQNPPCRQGRPKRQMLSVLPSRLQRKGLIPIFLPE